MKIVYRSRKRKAYLSGELGDEPVLEISWYVWDDFGYKTTFNATLITADGRKKLDQIKILFEGEFHSANFLEGLIESGWDGEFPVEKIGYISNPTQISFYEVLFAEAGVDATIKAANALRDASFLTRIAEEDEALALSKIQGFRTSLLRERGDQVAFADGWKTFTGASRAVDDITFRFFDRNDVEQTIELKYSSSSLLPHDINLLVGPNGVGKSQFLDQFVEHWLQTPRRREGGGFAHPPNFSRLIALSYSPFERLRVDTDGLGLAKDDDYQYFGLRGPSVANRNRVSLSLDHARQASVRSLISCAADDQRFNSIKEWSQKLSMLHAVLRQAIDFDYAAVTIPSTVNGRAFIPENVRYIDPSIVVKAAVGGGEPSQQYLRIDEETGEHLNIAMLQKQVTFGDGVTLFKDGVPLAMSSGQRLFSYIVINLLGSIRRNSLIVIDEPELFLHPSLEIALISMLKSILSSFACKALIATHSLLITREVPRDCVHVFEATSEGLFIKHPPFQTFGGDVQRISSYVFGDQSVSKPFERWIADQVRELGDRKSVLETLSPEELNEELLIELSDISEPKA